MRWTIGKKLFVALTVASLVVVGLNAAATRWSFQKGFSDYLYALDAGRLDTVRDQLSETYSATGSWDFIAEDRRAWGDLFNDGRDGRPPHMGPQRGPPPGERPPPGGRPPPPDQNGLRDRVSLVDAEGGLIIGPPINTSDTHPIDILVDGKRVGSLLLRQQPGLTEQVDLNFVSAQNRSILYIAAAVILIAAAIAIPISGQLLRPIRRLAAGTHKLAAGEFDERITVTSDDELGDLARDFNLLAESLHRSQQSRRQWVSDISHELRTPLAILGGELQAIEDGVRTFDDGTRSSLQAEVTRLQNLVADLHELTLSDEGGLRYHHETVDIAGILTGTVEACRNRANGADLAIRWQPPEQTLLVDGDSSRLDQLFSNLIENALCYTDSPGRLDIEMQATNKDIVITFADSPPGVGSDQYDRLFDRLYRADASRSRRSGGSGLGLSISEAIVSAHGGSISAKPSHLGGIAIVIVLPRIGEVRA